MTDLIPEADNSDSFYRVLLCFAILALVFALLKINSSRERIHKQAQQLERCAVVSGDILIPNVVVCEGDSSRCVGVTW